MDWLLNNLMTTIYYSIPWWAWLFIGATLALLVYRIWGLKAALAAATAALVATTYRKGQQTGWQDRQKKEQRDAERSITAANQARRDAARRDAEPGGLHKDDGWKRDRPL